MLISKFDNTGIEQNIEHFENKNAFKFPIQYRQFLIKYNGGKTPKTEFKINNVFSDVRYFYGLGEAILNCNYNALETIIKEFLADNVIPIANNSFGDYILIGTGKINNGKIYFYYHDMPKRFIELAGSFLSFLQRCKSEKIGHIKTIAERKAFMIELGKGEKITPQKIAGWQAEIDDYAGINQEEVII